MSGTLTGKLLVATPLLEDPNFRRTVVLVLAHDDNGTFGVVLNRPLAGAAVDQHLPQWLEHVAAPAALFAGGPVEPAVALGVAACSTSEEQDGWTPMAGNLGLVDLSMGPDEIHVHLERMRVFSGYAGWGAGQVAAEIGQNAWFVLDAHPDDPFTAEPETLWRRVLLRQRGEPRIYAFYPEDPSAN